MSERDLMSIDKLSDENFELWKFQMRLLFEKRGCLDVIEGRMTKPEQPTTTAQEIEKLNVWNKKDADGRYYIGTSIETRFMKHVITCETAKDMWDILCGLFEKKNSTRRKWLQKKLITMKFDKENQKVADYIADAKNLAVQLKNAGDSGVSEDMLQTIIIEGLPLTRFSGFMYAWNCKSIGEKTLMNLEAELITAEELAGQHEEAVALAASTSRGNKQKYKSLPAECEVPNKVQTEKFEGSCHFCKKKGHKKFECTKWKSAQENNGNKKKFGKQNFTKVKSSVQDDKEEGAFYANMAEVNVAEAENYWLADSGASFHMSHDQTLFEKLEKPEFKSIRMIDNTALKVIGKGEIKIEVLVEGKWKPWRLTNVYCVPEMKKNLFSYSACAEKGYEFLTTKDSVKIIKTGKVVATGIRHNNLYRMLFRKPKGVQANTAEEPGELDKLKLWHERFGHASLSTMQKMIDLEKLGLQKDHLRKFMCEACIFGKAKRKSFKAREPKNNQPGEFLVADVCGPFETVAYDGSRYYVVFKDYATEYRFIYPIKDKTEVFSKFKDLTAKVKNRFGRNVMVLKSDNGTEFCNQNFKYFCRQRGIEHETSAPYNPEQNGQAERDIRTINEMMKSMIYGRDLQKKIWSEAARMAEWILNRLPTSKSNRTPYERWYGKVPNLQQARVFGSTAYATVPKQRKLKLDRNAQELIFVGYQGNSENCRLLDPKRMKIIVSASVKFEEGQGEFKFCKTVGAEIIKFLDAETNEELDLPEDNGEEETSDEERPEEIDENDTGQEKQPCDRVMRDRSKLRKPDRLSYPQANAAEAGDPRGWQEAMSSPDQDKWKAAADEEISAHRKHGTWSYQQKPIDKKVITCKWLFKKKNTPGEETRYKARLVARGFNQIQGIDYVDTYAPVVRYESIRILLAHAIAQDMQMVQFDVKTAFLYGDLKEDIWIELPEGPWMEEERVVKLKKSLYGLKQSPHCWNEKLNEVLNAFCMHKTNADDCIYIGDFCNHKVMLALYVDDALLFCKSKKVMDKFLTKLGKVFEIKKTEPNYFVGIEIEHDRQNKRIKIHQKNYIEKMLEKFCMENGKGVATPIDPNKKLSKEMCPKSEAEKEEMTHRPYAELIGSLQFAANVTRFDIAFAVNVLSRFMQHPGAEHWRAAKRILQYLKETITEGIIYDHKHQSEITAYSDADFAGDEDGRKSTTGYVVTMQGGPISWASRRQKLVSLSTAEAEFIAATAVTQEVKWIRFLVAEITGMDHEKIKPITLHCDNQATIALTTNPAFHQRTKHIDVKYKFIRQAAELGVVQVIYCPTHNQLADLFTKGLSKPRFNMLKRRLAMNLEILSGSVEKSEFSDSPGSV